MKFAITKKIGMTRIFDDKGKHIPVTLLKCADATISRIKSADSKDGYNAVVIEVKSNKQNAIAKLYEFRVSDVSEYKVGDKVDASIFEENDKVTVESITKGKGFAGTIKRHGFHRGPVTHGSHNIRKPGSIGGGYPQRVVLGRKMAGRMGGTNSTTKNLKVVSIDSAEGIIAVSGAVSGSKNKVVKVLSE